MSDIMDVLKAEANRLDRRAYADRCVGPDCALSSLVADTAATEIERLRERVATAEALATARRTALVAAEGELAEAVEVVREFHDAAQIDAVMEGPRLTGWNRSALNRAWPKATAFLAKLEVRSDAIRAMEEKP